MRIQDEGLSGADDQAVLEWAAQNGRILLTHDVSTITHYAYDRVRSGRPMPGIFEVSRDIPINIVDGFVKSLCCPIFVIPAKAGIQLIQVVLDSCFRRSDGFSDFLRDHHRYR